LINGFARVWGATNGQDLLDWQNIWPKLMTFFEQLLFDPVFWQEKVAPEINLTPNRDWIPSAVADFLKAGHVTIIRLTRPTYSHGPGR